MQFLYPGIEETFIICCSNISYSRMHKRRYPINLEVKTLGTNYKIPSGNSSRKGRYLIRLEVNRIVTTNGSMIAPRYICGELYCWMRQREQPGHGDSYKYSMTESQTKVRFLVTKLHCQTFLSSKCVKYLDTEMSMIVCATSDIQ